MLPQQFQHADELPYSDAGTVPPFQSRTQFVKRRRKFPRAVDVRVVQSGRTSRKRRQIMQRIENLVTRFIAALMGGHDLIVMHDVNAIDVVFDRHGLESGRSWDAVADVVEPGELVLIDFRGLPDAGIEAMLRQRRRVLPVVLQPLTNRAIRIACWTRPIVPATLPQVRVEFVEILHAGNRRSPASLQRLDAILDDRLFVAAGGHTKQRLKDVVACQGRVPPIQLAIAAAQQLDRHGLRIVPPDFSRNTTEELEGLYHPFQNRFGSFRWQSDRKRRVRVRPHQDQHRNLSPSVGKIDVNLAEVGFQPLPGTVIQWDERLALIASMLLDEPANGIVTARIALLVPQPLEDPHRRMPLLWRLRLVVGENLPKPLMKRPQSGC